jgi:hypothetical protein
MPRKEPRHCLPPAPTVLAMILCDRVSVDSDTGKPTLHGCFRGLGASRFPATHPEMAVYAVLTNGRGAVPITVQLIDVDEVRCIFTIQVPVRFPDPLATIDVAFDIRDATFPAPGHYRLQIIAGGQVLMDRKLEVTQGVAVEVTQGPG